MDINEFGVMPDGTKEYAVTLKNACIECEVITYGAALRRLTVPDRSGRHIDVVLGFDTLEDYIKQDKYIGAVIGRFANRIGGASFILNGESIRLTANEGRNTLHGGKMGFDKRNWRIISAEENALTLSYNSADGEEGFPGALETHVRWSLCDSALEIEYTAISDRDTVCALTNHAYFNLAGHDAGELSGHTLRLNASAFLPANEESIPTGEIMSVYGTPMDFTVERNILERIDEPFDQLRLAGGYDRFYCLNGKNGEFREAGEACCTASGIVMRLFTDQPGLQLYTGNFLDGAPRGKHGAVYGSRSAFCLESGAYPDSPNKPGFPSALLKAGESYSHRTRFEFSLRS